jgi:hypothetical protein
MPSVSTWTGLGFSFSLAFSGSSPSFFSAGLASPSGFFCSFGLGSPSFFFSSSASFSSSLRGPKGEASSAFRVTAKTPVVL